MSKLKNLEPLEISIVDKGANKRKFLILKNNEKGENMDELINKILELKIDNESELDEELKKAQLSEEATKAVKAALKLLAGIKDMLPAGAKESVLSTLAQWAGYGYPQAGILKPVGYYPHPEKYGYASPSKKAEDEKKEEIISKIPEELKAELETLWKSYDSEITLLKKQTIELDEMLKKELHEKKQREFIEKAKTLKHIGEPEKIGSLLHKFFNVAPEEEKELEELLTNINNVIDKSSLFKEIGTKSETTADALSKLDQAATTLSKKKGISYFKAYDEVLKRPEMKKLYNEIEKE